VKRILASLSPDLTDPFFVQDIEELNAAIAKRKADEQRAIDEQSRIAAAEEAEAARKQAEEKANSLEDQRKAEISSFEYKQLSPLFATAGLQIGEAANSSLDFLGYPQRTTQIEALSEFYFAETADERFAYMTSDGTKNGPIVVFARAFTNKAVSSDTLLKLITDRLGMPNNASSPYDAARWYSKTVPEDRLPHCAIQTNRIGLATSIYHAASQGWNGRDPLNVDLNWFKKNCGIVSAFDKSSKTYVVADTTWLNSALLKALAAQADAKRRAEEDAVKAIDF
jgi:hypothetical protein